MADPQTVYKATSNFLRTLADDLDQGKLNSEQARKVFEFFVEYSFSTIKPESDEDIIRFLALGWYIYTQLLKK